MDMERDEREARLGMRRERLVVDGRVGEEGSRARSSLLALGKNREGRDIILSPSDLWHAPLFFFLQPHNSRAAWRK